MSNLGQRIKETRKKQSISQKALAEKLSVSQQAIQQVESGKAQKPKYLYELAQILGVSYEWLLTGQDMPDYSQSASGDGQGQTLRAPAPLKAADQIKIYELLPGGMDGMHVFSGNIADFAPRPRQLDNVSKAYAVYVYNNAMAPRYNQGELIFTYPGKPVSNGDYVVVHIKNPSSKTVNCMIAQLRARGTNAYVFNLINLEKTYRVNAEWIMALDKIIGASN